MKMSCLVAVVIALVVSTSAADAGNSLPWDKKVPFSSATIHYTISGLEQGRQILYIRDFGRERATYYETVTEMSGTLVLLATLEIRTPDSLYYYDLNNKDGFKGVNPQKYLMEEYETLSPKEQERVRVNANKMGGLYAEGVGGEVQQSVTEILGMRCDKVQIEDGAVTYLIHGTDIALKTELKMMDTELIIEASSIDLSEVESKHFEHPVGIATQEDPQADAMAALIAKQVLAVLRDPEGVRNVAMSGASPESKSVAMPVAGRQMLEQAEQMMQDLKQSVTQ